MIEVLISVIGYFEDNNNKKDFVSSLSVKSECNNSIVNIRECIIDAQLYRIELVDVDSVNMGDKCFINNYIKKACGYILLYDVTKLQTFNMVEVYREWIMRMRGSSDIPPCMMVGINSDNPKRVVPYGLIENLASVLKCPYYELPTIPNIKYEECLFDLVRHIKRYEMEKYKSKECIIQ